MRLRVNFQRGSLGASLTDTETTITFSEAPGFPTLASGEYIPIAIESEVVHLTAYTAGDTTGTIERGKEGTAKVAHDSGVDWVHGPLAFDAAHRDEVMAVVVHGNDSTVPRPEGYAVVNWIGDAEPANLLDHDVWDAPDPDPVNPSSQKAERLQESQRSVADGGADFGALDDAGGPSVEFRTDETGNAGVMLYAQGHVGTDGNTGYMSYRIVRVSDQVEVVGPSVVRALRWSYQFYASANFGPWIEHLDPNTDYRLEAVYQSTSGSILTCRSRRVQASSVLPSSGQGPSFGEAEFVYTASNDTTAKKLDSSGAELWSDTIGNAYNEVAVDNDGFVYLADSGGSIRKLDGDGNELWVYAVGSNTHGIAVDEAGFVYAGDQDASLHKVDSDGNNVWTFTGHSNQVRGVAVDGDGNVYSASTDWTVRKLDSSGNELWQFSFDSSALKVAVDPSGNVYAASADNTVRKLDSAGNEVWQITHPNSAMAVAVHSDGPVYSADNDGNVYKHDNDGNEVWTFAGHADGISFVAVDGDGYVYTASKDDTARKVDPDGAEVWSYTGHTGTVLGVAASPGAYLIAGHED